MVKQLQVYLAALMFLLISGSCFAASTITVTANSNLSFSGPTAGTTFTINKGDTVVFKNNGGMHNVVSNDANFCCTSTCQTGTSCNTSSSAWSSSRVFDTAGTFGIYCALHGAPGAGMHATIVVNDTATPPPPPPGTPITETTSGLWYDPQQSGQGFMIEILPSNVFLGVWFTFTPQAATSEQNWLYIQGNYTTGSDTITVAPVDGNARSGVLLNQGAAFPPNFHSTDLTTTQWGTMTFTFTDCTHATATWQSLLPAYGSGTINLQKLSGVAGLDCH